MSAWGRSEQTAIAPRERRLTRAACCAAAYLPLSLAMTEIACGPPQRAPREEPARAPAATPQTSGVPDAGSWPNPQSQALTALMLDSGPVRVDTPPLSRAAHFGELAHVQSLLRGGADVNARNAQGDTALMGAFFPITDEPDVHLDRTAKAQRWKRKLQIARLLIGHGAAVDAKSDIGETALSLAMSADADDRDLVSLLELMIDRGANVNAASTDAYKRTPLEGAIRSSRPRRVACLLRHGADPRATVYEGGNLLELAHALGNPNVIALLDGAAKTP